MNNAESPMSEFIDRLTADPPKAAPDDPFGFKDQPEDELRFALADMLIRLGATAAEAAASVAGLTHMQAVAQANAARATLDTLAGRGPDALVADTSAAGFVPGAANPDYREPARKWSEIQIVDRPGTEFGIVCQSGGVICIALRRPGEDWPAGHAPESGVNTIAEGFTTYVVFEGDDTRAAARQRRWNREAAAKAKPIDPADPVGMHGLPGNGLDAATRKAAIDAITAPIREFTDGDNCGEESGARVGGTGEPPSPFFHPKAVAKAAAMASMTPAGRAWAAGATVLNPAATSDTPTSGPMPSYPVPAELYNAAAPDGTAPKSPKPGSRWRHWKGGEYEVVALALQHDGGLLVVYKDRHGDMHARPVQEWDAPMGGHGPRFAPLPSADSAAMASRPNPTPDPEKP